MLPEGWKRIPLGECARFQSGGTPSKERDDYWGGNFPWITAKDMKTLCLAGSELRLTEAGKAVAAIAPAFSVLVLTRGMTLLKDLPIGLAMQDVSFNQDVKALIAKDGIDPWFLAYQLLANKSEILDLVDTAGHGTGRLDTELLKAFEVSIAPLEEQQAIVQIIQSWEDAISATENLLTNCRKQKQVLTQQLLTGKRRLQKFVVSSERLTTRFGSIPADWPHVPIERVAREFSAKNAADRQLPVLSCTKYAGLVDSLSYFNKQVFSQDVSTYKLVERGCFAYATNHIDEGSIGYQHLYDEALISPMYTVFKPGNEIDHGFLFKLLKTEHYRQIFAANTNASVDRRGSLRWGDFKKIEIPLPSMAEQVAISSVIDNAQHEIENLELQLERLKEEKRALMQQLLTGKRRVRLPDPEAVEA